MRTHRVAAIAALLIGSSIAAPAALAQADALKELPPTWAAGDSKLKWGGCPEGLPKGCQLAVLNGDPARPGLGQADASAAASRQTLQVLVQKSAVTIELRCIRRIHRQCAANHPVGICAAPRFGGRSVASAVAEPGDSGHSGKLADSPA